MKNMKKISDVVLSRKEIALESTAQQPTGTGRGLNIIRPTMSESSPRTKPLPTSTKTQKPIQKKPEKEVEPISATKKEESAKEPEISEESESKTEEELEITLEEALQKIVDRYNDPKVSSSFSKWDDTLMMTFPDIDTSYLYKINRDQGIELVKGYEEDAAVQVNIDSDVFIKMMTKQINPIKAYSSGKLEVVGKMRSLLKLRKLMF
jgi:putative sterol carrier protein